MSAVPPSAGRAVLRAAVAAVACLAVAAPAAAQTRDENRLLSTRTLAGQRVGVLPLSLLVGDPAVRADSAWGPFAERRGALARADSTLGEVLAGRAPEVSWVLPDELRRLARRNAGYLRAPDDMGQAILRSQGLRTAPDPLRSNLRALMAVANGRYALVPTALGFARDSTGGVAARFTLVIVDPRRGDILWRSHAQGTGATPDAALTAALETILPVQQ